MDGPASNTYKRLGVCFLTLFLTTFWLADATMAVPHSSREQARRMHDRIAGVPPSSADLNTMAGLIAAGQPLDAAEIAINNPAFYNVTLKTHVAPWTNRDQSQFVPLNDYIATVIGMVRDDYDFREILTGTKIYIGSDNGLTLYDGTNNTHYEELEERGIDLYSDLTDVEQVSVTGVPGEANAGVLTTRAAAEAFFVAGTNRAMFRFTLLNHMCTDLEPIMDTTRVPDRIRQDVSRSPGGDSRIFMNNCIGCHSGMDPMAGAFAYYNFDGTSLVFTDDDVQPKHLINANNFPGGYITIDDTWKNYWRSGPNQWLGWDPGLPGEGEGAKEMAREMAHSEAFAQCHVKKVFKTVCLRDPVDSDDRSYMNNTMLSQFKADYDLKEQFKLAGVHCMGEEEVN